MEVSVVIIAKNEADRLPLCLSAAAKVSDDIIVLDSGSTDGTIAVATSAGAKVIEVEWLGYGFTKNLGHTYAKHEWILSLDADEVMTDELISSLVHLSPEKGTVYLLDRMVKLEGQYIRHCGWHPDWVYRLFHKEECKWNTALVHEKLLLPAGCKTQKLNGVLTHYSFRSLEHFKAKTDQYARLTAKQWHITGKGPSLFKRLLGPWWKYMQTYFFYRGYRDGNIGRTIARVLADGVSRKLRYYKGNHK